MIHTPQRFTRSRLELQQPFISAPETNLCVLLYRRRHNISRIPHAKHLFLIAIFPTIRPINHGRDGKTNVRIVAIF